MALGFLLGRYGVVWITADVTYSEARNLGGCLGNGDSIRTIAEVSLPDTLTPPLS